MKISLARHEIETPFMFNKVKNIKKDFAINIDDIRFTCQLDVARSR